MKLSTKRLSLHLILLFTLLPGAAFSPAQSLDERRAQALQKLRETRERLPLVYEEMITLMDVRPGQSVAEIGAGSGEFAVKLARTVGLAGRVFANEVESDLVEKMEAMDDRESFPQLSIIHGREDDPRLPDKVERVFLNMVYHHLSDPDDFMTRLLAYVKPGGLLAVSAIDIHVREKSASGQHDPCVSDPDETRVSIENAGWIFQALKHPSSYNEEYILIFSAPNAGEKESERAN